jgi:hypothetical protein
MPRRPFLAHKTSLYRLVAPADGQLPTCIQQKYLKAGFQPEDVTIVDVPALLVHGVIPNPEPKWLAHLASLVDRKPDVYNYTAAAALLVPRAMIRTCGWPSAW